MNTQLEQAKHLLFGKSQLDVTNIKLFPGSNREISSEEMAQEISRAIAMVAGGDFEAIDLNDH